MSDDSELDTMVGLSGLSGDSAACPKCDLGPSFERRKPRSLTTPPRDLAERLERIGLDIAGRHLVETPNVAAIAAKIGGVHSKWTNDRIARLCSAINCPLHVLCASCGMFKDDGGILIVDFPLIVRCWESGRWPVSVTMHFENMEKLWLTSKS